MTVGPTLAKAHRAPDGNRLLAAKRRWRLTGTTAVVAAAAALGALAMATPAMAASLMGVLRTLFAPCF